MICHSADVERSYAYDDADRLASVTPPSPAPVVSYTWDDNGNLTARGSDSFAWDYEDRMVSATVNSVTTTFAYRGDGLRDSRTTGLSTTTFTWDIAAGLPVALDDGSQYVYGAGLESMLTASGTYYYLADGLGSTMAMVDSTGTVQKSYTYDVYGKPTATGALANEFDFAAQQTDPTGLQYLRARYMDPETGTFVSREPLESSPGWTGNPYGYAGANPVRMVDPAGLWPGEGIAKKIAKAAQDTVDVVLDLAAVPPYAVYYGAYEALDALDDLSEAAGSMEPAVDLALLPVTVPLTAAEAAGLAGDVGVDMLKDLNGTGQGWHDEGYDGSICPDQLDRLDGVPCPTTHLPGVHDPVCVEPIQPEYGASVKSCSTDVDFKWPFN